jgi:hypothetical protein
MAGKSTHYAHSFEWENTLSIQWGGTINLARVGVFLHRVTIWYRVASQAWASTFAWFIPPENMFPQLRSTMAARFTELQPTFGIARGSFRLVCGCSAMENHFVTCPTNSSCADIVLDSLELIRECGRTDYFYELRHSTLGGPALWACVVYHFAT